MTHAPGTESNRTQPLLLAALFALVLSLWSVPGPQMAAAAAGHQPLLTGTVRSASGTPLAGATVSARLDGSPMSVSVLTNERGRYYFPPLPAAGRYLVRTQAVGFEKADTELLLKDYVGRSQDRDPALTDGEYALMAERQVPSSRAHSQPARRSRHHRSDWHWLR